MKSARAFGNLGVLLTIALVCFASAELHAKLKTKSKTNKGHFVDAKKRFSVRLPHGWELAPMPGDLYGMMFRRVLQDSPAIFHVHVEKSPGRESLEKAMQRLTKDFSGEIGYRNLGDLPVEVAGIPAMRRTHSVLLSGDQHVVRYAVDTVFFAYGFVHFLHFETTEAAFSLFNEDLKALLGHYQVRIGRSLYQGLVGDWELVGGQDLRLHLGADLNYRLGAHSGWFRANGKRLTLVSSEGRESFRYQLSEDSLVVRNANLGGPMVYKRTGSGAPALAALTSDPHADDGIIGRWRVLDSDLALILSPSGAVQFGPLSGRYTIKGHLLSITSASGVEVTYHFGLRAGRLTLSGGDLDATLRLERQQ